MTQQALIDTYRTFDELLLEELKNPEMAEGYLQDIVAEYLVDRDVKMLVHCLKPLIQVQGTISSFAKKTGIQRTYLYKIFNHTVKPEFGTLVTILSSLGYDIEIKIKARKAG